MRLLLVAVAVIFGLSDRAVAQIPADFQGLWTSVRDNCTGNYSDGVTILGVSRSEVTWYEIACAPVDVFRSGDTLRMNANCEKGGGSRYTSKIELKKLGKGRLQFSWTNTMHGGGDVETVWWCPARHQSTFARDAHPTSGTYSHETTAWDHNGSKMALEANGLVRRFVYVEPRAGMQAVGASEGDILFNGRADDGEYRGVAYIFNKRCGSFPYKVRGLIAADYRRVVLFGKAPRVNSRCKITGYLDDRLEFNLLEEGDYEGDPNLPCSAENPMSCGEASSGEDPNAHLKDVIPLPSQN